MAVRGPRHPVGAAAHLGPCPLASCWLTTKSYPVSELSTLGDLFKERVSLTLLKATLMLHLGVLASSVELELSPGYTAPVLRRRRDWRGLRRPRGADASARDVSGD